MNDQSKNKFMYIILPFLEEHKLSYSEVESLFEYAKEQLKNSPLNYSNLKDSLRKTYDI